MTIKSKIWIGIGVLVLLVLGAQYTSEDGLLGFGTNRGFSTLPVTDPPAKTSYIFGVSTLWNSSLFMAPWTIEGTYPKCCCSFLAVQIEFAIL